VYRDVQHAELHASTHNWWIDQFVVEAMEGKERDADHCSGKWSHSRRGFVQHHKLTARKLECAAFVVESEEICIYITRRSESSSATRS
jgi:hypothetical protein